MQYKGYTGMYGFEDGFYFGRVSGLKRDVITFESEQEEEIEHEFQVSIDCYLGQQYTWRTQMSYLKGAR